LFAKLAQKWRVTHPRNVGGKFVQNAVIRAIVALLYGRPKPTEKGAADDRAREARTDLANATAEARTAGAAGWDFEGGDRGSAWMGKNRSDAEKGPLKSRDWLVNHARQQGILLERMLAP
jgi:hypothetical protein